MNDLSVKMISLDFFDPSIILKHDLLNTPFIVLNFFLCTRGIVLPM